MQSLGSTDLFPPVHHKLILNLGASPRCRSCAIDSWCLPGHRVIVASPFHGHSGSNQSVRTTPNDLQHKKLPLRAHQASAQSLHESRPAPQCIQSGSHYPGCALRHCLPLLPGVDVSMQRARAKRESVTLHDVESRVFLK